MKATIVGSLVLDNNDSGKYKGPGGSAYFLAKTLQLLGIPATIFSKIGKDFPRTYINGLQVYPKTPLNTKNLKYKNDIISGKRIQHVQDFRNSKPPSPSKIPQDLLTSCNTLIFSPILNNLTLNDLIKWKRRISPKITFLLPQGLLRTVAKNGLVQKNIPSYLDEFVRNVDFLIFSNDDIENSEFYAQKWSREGPAIIVTKDKDGCDLFINGKFQHFDTYPNNQIVDMNGLGDVFAGVFIASLIKNQSAVKSIKFANAGAALSKSYHSLNLYFTWKDLERIVKEGKVVIKK